jgi:competence protein ComEA
MTRLSTLWQKLAGLQRLKLVASLFFLLAGFIAFLGAVLLYSPAIPVLAAEAKTSSTLNQSGVETTPEPRNFSSNFITVDVSGGVNNPGIYHLPKQARVADAVAAAGNLSSAANMAVVTEKLNLAQKLEDGQKVYIPVLGLGEGDLVSTKPVSTKQPKASPKSSTKKSSGGKS